MMLYERRIESSLHKTMRELERRQLIRQFQQQEAEQELPRQEPDHSIEKNSDSKNKHVLSEVEWDQSQPSAGIPKSEYLNLERVKEDTVLKKQSQFSVAQNGAKSLIKRYYDNKPASRIKENKAKRSQFDEPF